MVRKLRAEGYDNLLLATRADLDLTDQAAVHRFFQREGVDQVYMAAARVGGIQANASQPADFLYENLIMAANVIHAAAQSGVTKLLYLGSSCIYPRLAPQPMSEASLLTGPLEPTNEGYAIAKIAGLKLCEVYQRQYGHRFISAMPTNLYGPGDNFHPEYSHVIPGMMGRFHRARHAGDAKVVVWGTGEPRREFLHVDDLANALFVLMMQYESPSTVNVGTGGDLSIRSLATLMKRVTGFEGAIDFDTDRPNGAPRKLLDVTKIRDLGWTPAIDLERGLEQTYRWALEHRVFDDGATR